MLMPLSRRLSLHVAVTAALSLALLAATAGAQAQRSGAGPFGDVVGSWSGNGTVSLANGSNERIRCQAAYGLGNDPNNLRTALRCASDSYKFELNSDVVHQGGSISGAWRETTRNLSGQVSGTAKPGEVAAKIEGPGFSGTFTVSTRGDKQSVTMRAPESELAGVTIALSRR